MNDVERLARKLMEADTVLAQALFHREQALQAYLKAHRDQDNAVNERNRG